MTTTPDALRLDALRAALLARREVLLEEQALRQQGATRVQHAREVLLQDADDAAAHGADREVDLALTDHERRELADIGAALDRLAAGDYGLCADCGGEIGAQRLGALPHATRCIGCESAREGHGGRAHRVTM